MKRILAGLLVLGLGGEAIAQTQTRTTVTSKTDEAGNTNTTTRVETRKPNAAVEIATQPVRDVDARRIKIPPQLVQAVQNTYSTKGVRTCAAIKSEIASLTEVLGADFGTSNEIKENKAAKLAEAGGKTIVNSIIPFRGLVREITGSAPAQRRLSAAIDAGYARRGFLRGLAVSRRCKVD